MNFDDFKQELIQDVKLKNAVTGEGSAACFAQIVADNLIEAEVLTDYNPAYYKGVVKRKSFKVHGYVYDEFDQTMTLIVSDYDISEDNRRLTKTEAQNLFKNLKNLIEVAIETDFYKQIEMSTPCADLIDIVRLNVSYIRKIRLMIFTNAEMSATLRNIEIENYKDIPVEGQIWDINRLFNICLSDSGKSVIEINFLDYCKDGIPCLEASSAATSEYDSYLGVIPGNVLADVYDKYGSRLLEGNVRSFLSTKVAVNKKIRATILNNPKMFFAFNNGISATAKNVQISNTENGRYITYAEDFQIINGGQTTASISNARFKDKANLDDIYVQIKLTVLDENNQTTDETDALIQNISRSSNSQNKVSDADFFASHPFHRRMEQISRITYAPSEHGAQYETIWFYERARGQYLQEQMRLTPTQKKSFLLQHPKDKVIKKTDLAKVQNCWLCKPHIVSKGAQTNFTNFADYIDDKWSKDESQFNEMYFKSTASLLLMVKYLEQDIPRQPWYQGGYRANIIYYTLSLFHTLLSNQYPGKDLDLLRIWNKQEVPDTIKKEMINISELVLHTLTDPNRPVANVTQWCKREDCWKNIKKLSYHIDDGITDYLLTYGETKTAKRDAKKDQKVLNGINDQTEVMKYDSEFWKKVALFSVQNHLISDKEAGILGVAVKIPKKIPSPAQSTILLKILTKARENGFAE